MGISQSEYGKIGALKFWQKFQKDSEFKSKIIKSRKAVKGTDWIKRVSILGVKAREIKKIKEEEKILAKIKEFKDNSVIARLCGFLAGDGCISITKDKKNIIHYSITFYPDNFNVAEVFIDTFNEIYGRKPHLKQLKNHFIVRIKSKLACNHLNKITSFNTLSWKPPFNILLSKKEKVEFLRAFFDCEAYISKKNIQVQSVNKKGLYSIKKLLKDFNIDSKIYEYERKNKNWNTNYILIISRKENIEKYAKFIRFNHSKKQEKLNQLARIA